VFPGEFRDVVVISPGDLDEAGRFLLVYGVDGAVFPNTDASGFELLRSFRAGFLQGAGACDVGVRPHGAGVPPTRRPDPAPV
jgi:hypothetical protein